MKSGIEEIAEERLQQQNKHGFTNERDDKYINDELVDAAMQYLGGDLIDCWPQSWDKQWYKPGDRILELRRAGALIASEIDRLKRMPGAKEPVYNNNGELIGHNQFYSSRGHLLVEPHFEPLGNSNVIGTT